LIHLKQYPSKAADQNNVFTFFRICVWFFGNGLQERIDHWKNVLEPLSMMAAGIIPYRHFA